MSRSPVFPNSGVFRTKFWLIRVFFWSFMLANGITFEYFWFDVVLRKINPIYGERMRSYPKSYCFDLMLKFRAVFEIWRWTFRLADKMLIIRSSGVSHWVSLFDKKLWKERKEVSRVGRVYNGVSWIILSTGIPNIMIQNHLKSSIIVLKNPIR